jgi:hypothetical protein
MAIIPAVMPLHRATARLATWIAALAVLLAALAPAVSHAVGSRDAATWVEICTTLGSKWIQRSVAPGEGPAEPAPVLKHALEHCPYCSIHTPVADLPPAASPVVPATALSHAVPRAFLEARHTLHAWVRAQPRAPPTSC